MAPSSEHPEPPSSIPPFDLPGLWRRYVETWLSHFLPTSALVLLALLLSSNDWYLVLAFLFVSALNVSAAQHVLDDTTIFSELRIRRVIYRFMVLVSTLALIGIGAFVLMLPLTPLSVAFGEWIVWTGLGVAVLWVLSRLWPIWVTTYMFRGTPADAWRYLFSAKLPDVAIAWRLTATSGALWRGAAPVLVPSIALGFAHDRLAHAAWLPGGWLIAFEVFSILIVIPFLNLLAVERARALALGNEQAFAGAAPRTAISFAPMEKSSRHPS